MKNRVLNSVWLTTLFILLLLIFQVLSLTQSAILENIIHMLNFNIGNSCINVWLGQLVGLSWNNVFVVFQASGDFIMPNSYGVDIKKSLFMKENIELQPLDVHME